jgi:hypothetical protein
MKLDVAHGTRPKRGLAATGLAALGLALGACAGPEPEAGPYEGDNPRDADQLWTPSQDDLDRAAAEEIDESNADAELERLRREVERGD